ncbi:MAG: DUF4388 domain-containing protein [Mycobacteriales bacterium]|nr:DUF4388 domain-containing protein [Mycobacteriales bacterium]
MSKSVLKGDLATTPLPQVLTDLAAGVASGCLHVDDGVEESKVFLRGGRVYAVSVPGRRPQLGARLVSSGALGPEALAEALEAQRTELQGWRLGELLVHLGYVDQPVVEDFVNEQLRESLSDLLRWGSASWRFRVNERTREDVAPPVEVADLLAEVDRRRTAWQSIQEVVHGPTAIPLLAASSSTSSEMDIDADAWALLCKVDGARSLEELARDCGFTLFEAGQVVYSLVQSGLVEVEEVLGPESASAPEPIVDTVPAEVEPAASRMAAAFTEQAAHAEAAEVTAAEVTAAVPSQAASPSHETTPASVAALITSALAAAPRTTTARTLDNAPHSVEEVAGSISRVSEALSALLGPGATGDDMFASPPKRAPQPPTKVDPEAERKAAEKTARDAKRRERDAAELAAAQAELEMSRMAEDARVADLEATGNEAVVVDLSEVRREQAEAERLAAEAAAAEAERASAEAAAEAERLAAEQAAQAAEVAAQLREEQAAAEAADMAAREAAKEAEKDARAEAQRLAAEAREAEQAAAPAVDPSAQAAAFAELSSAADSFTQPEPEVAAAPAADAEWDDDPMPSYAPRDTDTAALLRELSSLGFDDEPPPVAAPSRPAPSPARPAAAAAATKKRKGLFGR